METATVTVTSAGGDDVPRPSTTVSENVSSVSTVTSGAVKVGICAVAELSVTVGVPPVCVHA